MATITGGSGPDALLGTDEDDEIFGFEGNDTLNGGAGGDGLDGGEGRDWASYQDSANGVLINLATGGAAGGEAFGDGLTSIEGVIGSQAQDLLVGDGQINDLRGLGGNDVLEGAAGNDHLFGQEGEDSLDGGPDLDLLEGGADGDRLDGGDGLDFAVYDSSASGVVVNLATGQGAGGEAFGDELFNIEGVIGSAFQDLLTGGGFADRLIGGGGNDVMVGRGGQDDLVGEEGEDSLEGGDANDTLEGGPGGDHLDGGAGSDGASYLTSSGGVIVNLGKGTAAGGDAFGDTFDSIENITGSVFQDLLEGSKDANRIFSGSGNDVVLGKGGADFLFGFFGDDFLSGGNGADTLAGGVGVEPERDNLEGGEGNDELFGGTGADTLRGDAGADTFAYGDLTHSPVGADSQDTIEDFTRADQDLIVLAQIDANALVDGDQAFTFIRTNNFSGVAGQLRYRINPGGDTILQADVNGDRVTDFQIKCLGQIAFAAGDFVL